MTLPPEAYRAYYQMPLLGTESAGSRAIVFKDKRFKTGQIVTVGFIDGTTPQIAEFITAIEIVSRYTNIHFKVIPDWTKALLRIKHIPNQSWQHIGLDNLNIPSNKPTGSIGWSGVHVCIHELMHALGFAHEHQNPEANIPWDIQVLTQVFTGPFHGWTVDMIYMNWIDRLEIDSIIGAEYDPLSILHYKINPLWTTNGFETPENLVLSAGDILALGKIYAFPEDVELVPIKEVMKDGSILITNAPIDPQIPIEINDGLITNANPNLAGGLILGGIALGTYINQRRKRKDRRSRR